MLGTQRHIYKGLKDKTIQEGDVYATVCGAKEPRGRVRVLGLGPTPQEIGTPGFKGFMSTRMQMEILDRQRAESKNRALEQRIIELEEARRVHQSAHVEFLSQHDSNSRQYASPTPEGPIDVAHNAHRREEYDNYVEEENYDQYVEENENLLSPRHAAAPSVEMQARVPLSRHVVAQSATNMTTTPASDIHPYFAHDTHVSTVESSVPPRPTAPTNDGPRFHDCLVGKDVILFSMLKTDLLVAKGTIISTNPNTMVGGQRLGNEYCEVVVNVVMRRDDVLPRSYDL